MRASRIFSPLVLIFSVIFSVAQILYAREKAILSSCLLALVADAEMSNPQVSLFRGLLNFVGRKAEVPFWEGTISKRIYDDAHSYYLENEVEFNFRKDNGDLIHYLDLSREQYQSVLERMAQDLKQSDEGTKVVRENLARILRKHRDEDLKRIRIEEPKITMTRAELKAELRSKARGRGLSSKEAEDLFKNYQMSLLKNRDDNMLYYAKELAKLEVLLSKGRALSSDIDDIRLNVLRLKFQIHEWVLEEMARDLEGLSAQDFMQNLSEEIRALEGRSNPYVSEALHEAN